LIFTRLPIIPSVHNPQRDILENWKTVPMHCKFCPPLLALAALVIWYQVPVAWPEQNVFEETGTGVTIPEGSSSSEMPVRASTRPQDRHLTLCVDPAHREVLEGPAQPAGQPFRDSRPLARLSFPFFHKVGACGLRAVSGFLREPPCAPVRADLATGRPPQPKPPAVFAWKDDYVQAMDAANQQRKMLLILFTDPANGLAARFSSETLADPAVEAGLHDCVCARLPVDARIQDQGKEVRLLDHVAFREMLGQPGIAILDFAHPQFHGTVVSTFPLTARLWYTPRQVQTMLGLPPGTLTQRTLIYAVRTHPEAPASAGGQPDPRLLAEAQSHSEYQASIRLQGHHRWESRFPRISAFLGCSAREVCAESWPGQNLLEGAIECVHSWRLSHGHWSAVRSQNQGFGYDMKLGSNGVWYATGIFGLR
jgi:hypothetical protein